MQSLWYIDQLNRRHGGSLASQRYVLHPPEFPTTSEPIPQATVAGTIVGVNMLLNRETRDALSPSERSYLHEAFQYTGGGLAVTALAARAMFRNGFTFRVMAANPWVVLGVSLVGSIGTMAPLPRPPGVQHGDRWRKCCFVRAVHVPASRIPKR